MKFSRIRIALLTFFLGINVVPVFNYLHQKWDEPFIELPQVKSNAPIYIFQKYHHQTDKGGGGGSGGQTCDDFVKSLGKLTKQSRRILAESPCRNLIPER